MDVNPVVLLDLLRTAAVVEVFIPTPKLSIANKILLPYILCKYYEEIAAQTSRVFAHLPRTKNMLMSLLAGPI